MIPISSAEMQRIGEASLELKRGNPALYLVHLCFRHLGMRNKEIEAARVEWIDRKADGSGAMAIVQRTYFDPKQSQGRVPISADVLAEMDEALAAARKEDEPAPEQGSNLVDFLVPAKTKTERWELINVHHSAWMRRFLPDHPKSSYELRRWASMVVRRRQGSDAQEQFLRHKAKTVAGIHYSYEIEVQPVTLADCGL